MSDPVKDLALKLAAVGAPLLGRLVGGGAGALIPVVVDALAEALGASDATPDAVRKAIDDNPNAGAIVQRVEARQGGGLTQLEAELADVQNARATTVKLTEQGSLIAWGATVVSILIVLGFLATLLAFVLRPIPLSEVQATALNILLGTLATAFVQVCGYWLGSSAGSARQGDTVRRIALSAGQPKR